MIRPMKLGLSVLLVAFATIAHAQSPDWQKTWDETLAAAKKEGKVVIVGSPDPVMRREIIPKFTERFGIPVEFIAGSSSQLAGRIRTERSSGIYAVDVFMSGADTTINVLHPQKMIDPLKPLLILPEVTDGAKWKNGKPRFVDKEQKYILQLFSSVDTLIFINTDFVKPEEMRAAKDLLNPKWMGKIVTDDPNATGSGSGSAVHFYTQLGADFVKKLYVDQKPVISRDRRQTTDWLARGVYPICLTCRPDDVQQLNKEGYKLVGLYRFSDMLNRVKLSPFVLTVANKAPHPNAARVFVNWMAGKDAVEAYSRDNGVVSLRTDVDESFLNPGAIPQAGVQYPDGTDPDWIALGRVEAANKVRELLKAQ
ncbi:MAG: extracellular solute-binding protein [Xanthobacteraceae bacterium]